MMNTTLKLRTKVSNLLLLGVVILPCLCGSTSFLRNSAATEPSVTSLWVSSDLGGNFDIQQILARNQNLKKIYIPMYQNSPMLSSDDNNLPTTYLAREKGIYELCHRKHIDVIGIFSPIALDPISAKRFEYSWLELPLADAFSEKSGSLSLNIFNSQCEDFLFQTLTSCLINGEFDGVIMDVNYPISQLYGYSKDTRADLIKKFGEDPVDYVFPLGVPNKVSADTSEFTSNVINFRFDKCEEVFKKFYDICTKFNKKPGVLGLLDLYQYPPATQAAVMENWAEILIRFPDTFAVLGQSQYKSLTVSSLKKCNDMILKLKVHSQVEVLLRPNVTDIYTYSIFQKSEKHIFFRSCQLLQK